MRIGSVEHKELFCRSLIESHIEYEPEQLLWPELDAADLERLRKIPFWEEALNTELAAGAKVNAYLPMVSDPLVRQAIALQGQEEVRHGRLFQFMIEHYGINLSGKPPCEVPEDVEPIFVNFGYSECLDAFLGFGMFKIARQSEFLPEAMFNIFDLLLQDEARHIVFFVNWIAYLQVQRGRGAKLFRAAMSLWNYGIALQGLFSLITQNAKSNENDFSATEASVFLNGFSVERMLSECLEQNAQRMSGFDPRLLQPQLLPEMAKVALSVFSLFPKPSQSCEKLAS